MDTLLLTPAVTLVSPSRTRTFLECPKKYDYIYNKELKQKIEPKGYFNKGNLFHEWAHVYYQNIKSGLTPGSDIALHTMINRMREHFTTDTDPELISVYGIITKMMARYITEQSPKIDKDITVVNVEQQLIYPMARYAMFGYADLLYRDRSGRLHIRDHKTGERAQTKLDAQFSNQLLFYAAIVYKSTGEIPIGELSYINTKEYARKSVTHEEAFILSKATYTERELDIYFEEICVTIENMLQSRAVPHYGQHCRYCPFQTPCFVSRKGIDQQPILDMHYVRIPRDSQGRHLARVTENNSNGNGAN